MIRTLKVNELKSYCRTNKIKNYSKFKKNDLIDHIIKYKYFYALKNYNSSDEELYQIMKQKLVERREVFEACEDGEEIIETLERDVIVSDIKDTIENIQQIKQKGIKNDIEKEFRTQLLEHRVLLQKLKEQYEKITGNEWSTDELLDFSARPDNLQILIEGLSTRYSPDKFTFDEVNIERYDKLYEDFKRHHYSKYNDVKRLTEQILYHGTDETKIKSILDNDFALINHRRHGSAYGNGIYFTNSLEKACSYSTDRTVKYVLVCNVHIGNRINGTQALNMLSDDKDTAVDYMHRPVQFIKKKNHQYTFLGILKIELSPTSQLNVEIVLNRVKGPKCILTIKNNTFSMNIEILFIRHTHLFPTALSLNDLFFKVSEYYNKCDKAKNITLNFQKLLPAKVKSFTNITTNMDSIYIIGYYENTNLHIMRVGRIDKLRTIIDY